MKIAKEIVNEMRETFCWEPNSPLPGLSYAIIAAKLEPVKEALNCNVQTLRVIFPGPTHNDQREAWHGEGRIQLALNEQTLALFEEA